MAEFMEQIRRELPGAEIVHNSLWFDGDSDPYVRRQHDAADLIEIERGINDSGLRGGEGFWSLRDAASSSSTACTPGARASCSTRRRRPHAERLYGLAGYFLISDGRDALGNYQAGTPEDWWAGYDTDLGDALGARYDLANGVIRRDFTRGTVLMNVPDTSTQTVSLGAGYRDLDGVERSSVTLGPGTGAVLLRTSVAAPPAPVTPPPPAKTETTIDPPTAPNVPTPATPTATPTPPSSVGRPDRVDLQQDRRRRHLRVDLPRQRQARQDLRPRRRRHERHGQARHPAQDGRPVEDGPHRRRVAEQRRLVRAGRSRPRRASIASRRASPAPRPPSASRSSYRTFSARR